MADKVNNIPWILLLALVFLFVSQKQPEVQPDVDLSDAIDAGVTFNGEDIYLKSRDLTTEYVRIIRNNGDRKDLGYKSLDAGTLAVTPNVDYKFYFFMNGSPSDSYYVDVQDYTGLAQDSTDNVIGKGCQYDSDLVFAGLDENGNVQTATANAISLTAAQVKTGGVRIKVSADSCYGTPGAPKNNVLCFMYPTAGIADVSASTAYISLKPRSIVETNYSSGNAMKCYELPLIADTEAVEIEVTITGHATNEPTSSHDVIVYANDIGFDLHGDTLDEIWGYEDELGNDLGATAEHLGFIEIS